MKLSSPYREPIFVNALFILKSPQRIFPGSAFACGACGSDHVSRLETTNKCLNGVFEKGNAEAGARLWDET
jgi:hypothetical protein